MRVIGLLVWCAAVLACDVPPQAASPGATVSSGGGGSSSGGSSSGAVSGSSTSTNTTSSTSQSTSTPGCFEPAAALMGLAGNTLVLVGGDGNQHALFTLGAAAGAPAESVVANMLDIRRTGYAAVSAFIDGASAPYRYEQVLLASNGTVLWHRLTTADYNPTLYLNDDGMLAIATYDRAESMIVFPDGSEHPTGRYLPMAAVTHGGLVPAYDVTQPQAGGGWYALADGTFRPFALNHANPRQSWSSVVGESLLAPDGVSPDTWLVEEPAGGWSVTLPAQGGWAVESSTQDGRVLMRSVSADQVAVQLNLATHQWVQLSANRPDAFPVGQGTRRETQLLDDGRLMMGLSQGTTSSLFESADLGVHWAPVLTTNDTLPEGFGPAYFAVRLRGGRLLVEEKFMGYGEYIAGLNVIGPGVDRRVDTNAIWVNGDAQHEPGMSDLREDGKCAVVWRKVDGGSQFGPASLVQLDVDSGEERALLQTQERFVLRYLPR